MRSAHAPWRSTSIIACGLSPSERDGMSRRPLPRVRQGNFPSGLKGNYVGDSFGAYPSSHL